jgi:hypothetical protein
MIRRKEVKGLFLLLVSITVFLGLPSVGCKKESEKSGPTGQAGFPSSTTQTGQQGFPSSTTGQTTFTSSTTEEIGACPVWFKDADGDGYTDGVTEVSCEQPGGYVSQAQTGDCDDNDKNINPNTVWFKDKDKDGYTDGTTVVSCTKPSDEYVSSATAGDCDDEDSSINPGRAEICDGIDNNCNGFIDEGVKLVFYKDLDGDGYTDGTTQVGCSAPSGYVLSAISGDCNDNDPNVNSGKTEICDGKDNNCNGQIDEGFNVGQSCTVGVGECARTGQYVCKADGTGTQCNATPGTPTAEICDGKDNNCNGQIDEGFNVGQSCTVGVGECARTGQYVCKADGTGTQCNATPGTPTAEICDGKDNNCNGQIDEGFNVGQSCTVGVGECARTGQYVCKADGTGTQCNATPGTPTAEICDGKDNNCNGQIDEGFNVGQSCTVGVGECARTGQYVCKADGTGTQCNATPGTPTAEICDGRDNDCDGQIDEGIVCISFAKTIGRSSSLDEAWSIIQSSDGGYAVAGFTYSFGAGWYDFYVVKLDSGGNVQWTKIIGGSGNDVARSIIQSSDGGYVVAGYTTSFGAGNEDIYVVKLDSGGNVEWTKTIGGSYADGANSIIQSSDGGYVVAGYTSSSGAGSADFYVVKLDSGGNVEWTKTIGGSYADGANSIIQSSDGGYVVAGYTDSFGVDSRDIYVVKLDSGGNVQWTKTIVRSSSWDEAYSIIQSSDGGYVVAGETLNFGGTSDFYVVKLDSGGNVQWTKTIGGISQDEAYSIIQSSDGGYVVAGRTLSFGAGGWDIYVVKLDSGGNVEWTKTIGGSDDDRARSIIQSSDGGYAVAGHTWSFGAGGDMYVVKMYANLNVCFSQNITKYSVSSNVGSSYSPSPVVISQSPTVSTISPTISSGGSASDVCPSSPAPHLNICSGSQDCGFGSAVATNKEDVKSYGCSAGGVLSRFLIPASVPVIIYVWLRRKRKKKKGF